MTTAEARQELHELANLQSHITQLRLQREELNASLTAVRVTDYSTSGHGGASDGTDKLNAVIDKLSGLDEKYFNKLYDLQERQTAVLEKINKLPYPFSEMLTRRFVKHERYEKIADAMGYSYYYVCKRGIPTAIKKYADL